MPDNYLQELIILTIERNKNKIKEYLFNLPLTIKGIIFESYLRFLYEGNGWIAVRNGSKNDNGADILLYHPKTPNQVSFIIQGKNHDRTLSYDDTLIEIMKFEKKSRIVYSCNNYIIISLNGFAKSTKALEEFNMKLETWEYIENLIDKFSLNKPDVPRIEIYAHNKISYEKSKEMFLNNNLVAIVQATGTGKSYIIIKYLSDFIDKRSLILAPSTYILDHIKEKATWSSANTIFITYAKLKNLSEKELLDLKPNFIALDEFHRCGSEHWGSGVKRLLALYPDAHVLGTTATPVRYLDKNRDMSDELFYGNVAQSLSLSQAIVKNILPMPIYVTALYTLEEEYQLLNIKILNSKIPDKDSLLNKLMSYKKKWEKSDGIPEVLNKHIKENYNKFIVFCENKEHLSNMEWLTEMWFKKSKRMKRIKKYRVISGDNEADYELESFRNANSDNTIFLLFVIDMLNEGFHIDDINGVILLRETKSPRIFFQQIGRAMQAGNINSKPLIFDFVNNFNNICVGDFLTELNNEKQNEVKLRKSIGLDDNCPQFTIVDETKEEVAFFCDIENRIKLDWDFWYSKLTDYYMEHGTCYITNASENYFDLSKWAKQQRRNFKMGLLDNDKISKLELIEFIWDYKEYDWMKMYKNLIEYNKTYNSFIIKKYKVFEKLSDWASHQRMYCARGVLPQHRIDYLNKIDFVWNPNEQTWQNKIAILQEFFDKFGYLPKKKKFIFNGIDVGEIIVAIQKLYVKGILSETQIETMNKFGYDLNRHESKWKYMYSELVKYKNEFGHCNVSRVEIEYENLAFWVSSQRLRFKNGKLADHRKKLLDELGFIYTLEKGGKNHKKYISRYKHETKIDKDEYV